MRETLASMGTNMLVIFPGAASNTGVSVTGGVPTLTPEDADAIAQYCSAVSAVAPLVRARAQVIYGSRNWVPMYIYGTTPSFLAARDWEEIAEGDVFSAAKVMTLTSAT